jgi:hypothetical protein
MHGSATSEPGSRCHGGKVRVPLTLEVFNGGHAALLEDPDRSEPTLRRFTGMRNGFRT